MSEFVRPCAADCGDSLPPQHLRVQLAPPHEKWHEIRVHDLDCLLDYLEDEEDKVRNGKDGRIFKPTRLPVIGPVQP